MIDFKTITPADKDLLVSYTFPTNRRDRNLSIGNLCCWQFLNCSSYALLDDQLILRFCFPNYRTVYTLPAGEKAGTRVIGLLAEQAREEELPLYLYGIVPEMQAFLDRTFPDLFEYHSHRDHFDYLYLRSELAALKGQAYRSKRNHVHKFRKTYDYRFTPMTAEMITDCIHTYDRWCEQRHCMEDESLAYEHRALLYGLEHFRELGLTGGVLWVEGKIIAFTFGSPVNHDTFCIHAEKALSDYEGAYNTINQEFASFLPECYTYLNREEDLGLPGLRKAKLSYRPVDLLEKGLAVCAEGTWESLIRQIQTIP